MAAKQYLDKTNLSLYDELIKDYIDDHSGSSDLADLGDVSITSPATNEVLKYNSTSGKWENGTGGGSVTGVKGDSESSYRTGDVNITKANIGLGNVPNVATNDQTPTFTEASERENIASGETVSTIFGKIKKFFSSLKEVAFTGSYIDLIDKPNTINSLMQGIPSQDGTVKVAYQANGSVTIRDISCEVGGWDTKADKDTNAVEGTIAVFDQNGNPVGSNYLANRVAIKPQSTTPNNVVVWDQYDNPADSGIGISQVVTSGNIVLQINPTDASFKATPGAIWIET